MAENHGAGRTRSLVLAVCAVVLAAGVALVGWVLTNQTGDPPVPDEALSITAGQGGEGTTTEPAPSETPADTGDTGVTTAPPAPEPDAAAETSEPPEAPPSPTALPTEEKPDVDVEALPASEPVGIEIPAIEVTSPLHPLGLREDGSLEVPSGDRYDEAAWYDGSVTPGEAGVSVIEGHVTSQGSVPSIFFELGALEPGDEVEVERDDGTTATFEVYALDTFPKDGFPTGRVFGNSDTPELRLITCGGVYNPEEQSHEDNIVVFAAYTG